MTSAIHRDKYIEEVFKVVQKNCLWCKNSRLSAFLYMCHLGWNLFFTGAKCNMEANWYFSFFDLILSQIVESNMCVISIYATVFVLFTIIISLRLHFKFEFTFAKYTHRHNGNGNHKKCKIISENTGSLNFQQVTIWYSNELKVRRFHS